VSRTNGVILVCPAQAVPGLPRDSCPCRCHRNGITSYMRRNRIYNQFGWGFQCRRCGFRTIDPPTPGEFIAPQPWSEFASEIVDAIKYRLGGAR
jgi:hypothetical protein